MTTICHKDTRPTAEELAAQSKNDAGPVEYEDKPRKLLTPVVDPVEAARLTGREVVREQMAAAKIYEQRRNLLADRLRQYDADADVLADRHREICGPAQAVLAKLESQMIDQLANRLPVSAELENRRAELMEVVSTANEALSDGVERIKRLRGPVQDELQKAQTALHGTDSGGSKLGSEKLGNPVLLAAKFVARQEMNWAEARRNKARKFLSENRVALTGTSPRNEPNEISIQARDWQAEYDAAQKLAGAALAKFNAAHQALIDE